jgi:hypothetical protein
VVVIVSCVLFSGWAASGPDSSGGIPDLASDKLDIVSSIIFHLRIELLYLFISSFPLFRFIFEFNIIMVADINCFQNSGLKSS